MGEDMFHAHQGTRSEATLFSLAALGVFATQSPTLASERFQGEVALSAPGACDAFVVSTGETFSLLREREHYALYEGDLVRGALRDIGDSDIEIVGQTTLAVTVEQSALTLDTATALYRKRCGQSHD
jgi:hypothetical protein